MADVFHTTRWSVVVAAGREESSQALETLCQSYWFPIYAYIRRRSTQDADAKDLTQAFFANLLSRQTLAEADPNRGRFRAYLLTACKRFLANEYDRQNAQKRGGQSVLSLDFATADSKYPVAAVDDITPEVLFEQQWAITLIETVLAQLRQHYVERNKLEMYDALKVRLSGGKAESYAEIGRQLQISETAVKVEAHRLKTRYREQIRTEIGHTVDSPDSVEDEIRRLFDVLSQKHEKPL